LVLQVQETDAPVEYKLPMWRRIEPSIISVKVPDQKAFNSCKLLTFFWRLREYLGENKWKHTFFSLRCKWAIVKRFAVVLTLHCKYFPVDKQIYIVAASRDINEHNYLVCRVYVAFFKFHIYENHFLTNLY
jgi:hypothetical protein